VIDAYLAGRPHEELLASLHHINVNPLDRAVVDVGV
jgi:hypothetical protein